LARPAVVGHRTTHAFDRFLGTVTPGLLVLRVSKRIVFGDLPHRRLRAVALPVADLALTLRVATGFVLLGVRYVLEGSVRKGGGRVRITAQLIDALSGTHLWADRFDGALEGVFELQDKVASSAVGLIEPALQAAETACSAGQATNDLTAYDLYLRAIAMHFSAALPPEDVEQRGLAFAHETGISQPRVELGKVCGIHARPSAIARNAQRWFQHRHGHRPGHGDQ